MCLKKQMDLKAEQIHKAKVTVTFLKEEALSHLPYSPSLAPCDFWLFPFIKKKSHWLDGNFPAFRTSQKQSVQISMHCLHLTIKMPLNLGADDWNSVCEAEESTLKECEGIYM